MGRSLFAPTISDLAVPTVHAIAFGQYPPQLVQRAKHRDMFFKPDGQHSYTPSSESPS